MNDYMHLYKNSVKHIKITVPDVPDGLTITKAYLMMKVSLEDLDNNSLVSLTITNSPTTSGTISDTGADGEGVLEFVMDANTLSQISDLSAIYYIAVKVILSNGSAYLLPNGIMPAKVHIAAITATS